MTEPAGRYQVGFNEKFGTCMRVWRTQHATDDIQLAQEYARQLKNAGYNGVVIFDTQSKGEVVFSDLVGEVSVKLEGA